MRKRRIVKGLVVCLAVFVFVACLWSLITTPHWILEKEKEELLPGELISVKTEAKDCVFLGDVTDYRIKIIYNSQKIEIDKTSFYSVNFEPFEIREVQEREFAIDRQTTVYLREYKIQLVEGEAGRDYEFPSIVVRYREKGSKNWLTKVVVPQQISVPSRFPEGTNGHQLKSPKEKAIDLSTQIISLMFFGGGILGTVWIAKIWKGRLRKKPIEVRDYLFEVCENLRRQLELGKDPKIIVRQIFPVLMMVLAKKEKIDWFEFELPKLPEEIADKVQNLYKACEESYRPEGKSKEEVEKMISDLREIVRFYIRGR